MIQKNCQQVGIWSSGMILASGARGPEFDSRNAPICAKEENSSKIIKIEKYKWFLFFVSLL